MTELEGRLYYAETTGYLLLSVPNALATGAFRSLPFVGLELPRFHGQPFSAHITVMRPDEVQSIGGSSKISERGRSFRYSIKGLEELVPPRAKDYSRFWAFIVSSPPLLQLRKSYGLGVPLVPLHITVAARKNNVLYDNGIRKLAAAQGLRDCLRNEEQLGQEAWCSE